MATITVVHHKTVCATHVVEFAVGLEHCVLRIANRLCFSFPECSGEWTGPNCGVDPTCNNHGKFDNDVSRGTHGTTQ